MLTDERLTMAVAKGLSELGLASVTSQDVSTVFNAIREAERNQGEPVVNVDATQAYADKVLEVIPWQKCPVCDGHGLVKYPPGLANGQSWSDTSSGPWHCECCHGARVIPMVVAHQAASQKASKETK